MDPEIEELLYEHHSEPPKVPGFGMLDSDLRAFITYKAMDANRPESGAVLQLHKFLKQAAEDQNLLRYLDDLYYEPPERTAMDEIDDYHRWRQWEEDRRQAQATMRLLREFFETLATALAPIVTDFSDAIIIAMRPILNLLDEMGVLPGTSPMMVRSIISDKITMDLKNINPDAVRLILGQSPDPGV